MINLSRSVIWLLFLFAIMACSKSSTKFFSKKEIQAVNIDSSLIRDKDFAIHYNTDKNADSITLKYLGSGGYYFTNGRDAFIIDPFFSPSKIFTLTLKKIFTDTANVARGLVDIKSDIYANVEAIFITHSHYDHLMDAPYVFNHYLDTAKSTTKIYGSSSMKSIISAVVDSTHIDNIENKSGSIESMGEWIYLNDGKIRVMPIITKHAPHYNKLVSICLYGGEGEPIKRYDSDITSTHVTDWRVGSTFAYLIDFMNTGKPEFRIYLLSSASRPPDGFVHDEILKEHKVNLAILGAASFDNVENYPQGILQHLNPEKVLIAHWEDLFKPYLHNPPRLIRATNFKKLIPEINEVYPWKENNEQQLFMPVPGVLVSVVY